MNHLLRFFKAQVLRAFGQLGITDTPIIDHVSSVLATFARSDHLYRMRSPEGKSIDSVVAMLREIEAGGLARTRSQRERDLRQYIGDYALFMSGIFRPHVERGGYLNYYLDQGRRSYHAVSALDLARFQAGFLLFQELAERFEMYSGALDYLRKSQFAPLAGEDPVADFLRQVDGWIRVGISDN